MIALCLYILDNYVSLNGGSKPRALCMMCGLEKEGVGKFAAQVHGAPGDHYGVESRQQIRNHKCLLFTVTRLEAAGRQPAQLLTFRGGVVRNLNVGF